jgi:hypothetical protein
MKTYFLALNNSDFNISGNTWTSNVIDLYSNRFYTNFSTLRSQHGLNELGDYTFVGTELRPDATPTLDSTTKVTNYGEIILEQTIGEYDFFNPDNFQDGRYIFDLVESSPFWIMGPDYESQLVYRFVDTTSRVDIIGYKHAFANLPGAEQPTVQVKIYTADKEDAQDSEWLQVAYVNQSTTLLFIRDVKRYCKFEVVISSDSSLENSNFLLLVQTQIDEIAVPVISDHTRSVLARFPSWTKIYGDSLERATPSLALPETNAGKMINALIGDDLDKIDELISRIELDSYIGSATLSETAWMYVSTNVAPGFIKIIGDNTELARVSTMRELLETRATDYVFYYNFSTLELYTLRKFVNLKVDNTLVDQIVIQSLNSFDEFGVRVGLQRLYLESNLNFSKRILDVYRNPPAINAEGLKLTLRRELDIWRAVGATPESTYLGATPEILEISDLEAMSKYFSKDGIPTKEFFDFVEYINVKYPTNYGYIKWGEAYWDYAGKFQEGISSIPTILDSATPQSYSNDYQPGIGDFEDARLKLEKLDREIIKSSFGLRVSGIKFENTEPAYEPIDVKYDSYISYYEDYVENNTATISYDVKLLLNLHGDIPNDAVYTARFSDYITNIYDQTSSPEYIVRSIFNSSGFTTGDSIYYNQGGTPYVNTFSVSATESYTFNEIPLYSVDAATVSFISSSGPSGATGNYATIGFLDATPNTYAKNTSKNIIKTAAQINDSSYATKLKINSEIYDAKKRRIVNTPKIRSDRFSNKVNNSNDITQQSAVTFTPQDIIKNFIIPFGATPVYVHIENVIEDSYDIDLSASPYQGYGGISKNRDQNKTYLIPSVPNVLFSFINPNFATPEQHENYIDTIGSTVNYYFTNIKFPFSATPNQLRISSNDNGNYPFNYLTWENFTANYIGDIEYYISDHGVVSGNSTVDYSLLNNESSYMVGRYDFSRSDFGLSDYDSSPNLIISTLEVINEDDNTDVHTLWNNSPISIYTEEDGTSESYIFQNDYIDQARWQYLLNNNQATPEGLLNYLDPNTGKYTLKNIPIWAFLSDPRNKSINPSIKTGWYYQDGEERYIYAKPKTESVFQEATPYEHKHILLPQVARQGAPIIVSVDPYNDNAASPAVEYMQVAFSEEATPSAFSYYNYEYITSKYDDYLALAYSNIFDITIKDEYTGQTVASGLHTPTNIIDSSILASSGMIKAGREYRVSYRVKNTFNVDNQYFYEIDNSYRSLVTLLSTPDTGVWLTEVTYESALFDTDAEIDTVSLNPLYVPNNEGYVFISHNSYDLGSIEASLTPREILSDNVDYMALNIWSYDINGNPKPNIPISISGLDISAMPSTLFTSTDGYARAYISYMGDNVATPTMRQVLVQENRSTPSQYSAIANYMLKPDLTNVNKLSAEVTKKIINADGEEKVYIFGNATPNASVYWRRGRNLYLALNTEYSTNQTAPEQVGYAGMTTADANGNFQIGPYRAQNDATPGYWFTVVDSEFSPTPTAEPVTIVGDIVYWYERYDVNQSNSGEPTLPPDNGSETGYAHYLSNPAFKMNEDTEEVYYENTFENSWNLPIWYPISRYDQYQMGLFGSTPYIIDTYQTLRPDYEEE